MAFLTMSMFSSALQMDTNVSVLLPEHRRGGAEKLEPEKKYPVIYCLHGHGDDHTAWIRKSCIETVARQYEAIVVMPTVQRGYYTDSQNGLDYFTYITEELPIRIANYFPISIEKKDTFLIGNSMGGYGALKAALTKPEQYAAVYALSPALPEYFHQNDDDFGHLIRRLFGSFEDLLKSDNCLKNLIAKRTASSDGQPAITFCCGKDDALAYGSFLLLKSYFKEAGGAMSYAEHDTSGGHDWDFWNPEIKAAIESFGLKKL